MILQQPPYMVIKLDSVVSVTEELSPQKDILSTIVLLIAKKTIKLRALVWFFPQISRGLK
jgi:hypothetical protein